MTTTERLGLFAAVWGLGLAVVAASPGLADAAWDHDRIVFLDRFNEASFAGSDGNRDWNGPWNELAEADGPKQGIVRVKPGSDCDGHCLVIGGHGVGINGKGVVRAFDFTDAAEARVRFEVDVDVFDDEESSGSVTVAVAAAGGTWMPLAVYRLDWEDDS
jgi:hypothetical protein